jgi:addiction module HigA family antidote
LEQNLKTKLLPLTSLGEVLNEEFMEPLGITEYKLAQDIGVPRVRINAIVRGSRAITPGTAVRFGLYFGTTPQFWLNLQSDYELRKLAREGVVPKIERCLQLARHVAAR